jgi:hypothetical protein
MKTPTPTPSDLPSWQEVANALANALGKILVSNTTLHPALLKTVFGAIEQYVQVSTATSESDDWWAGILNSSPTQQEWNDFMSKHQWNTDEGDTDDSAL